MGFTLVELLVVITVLAILAGVVIFAVGGIGDKGRDNAVAADARILRTAEEAHCAKYGKYASVEELRHPSKRLLAPVAPGAVPYNTVVLGDDGDCGTGENSSYTLNDITAPTEIIEEGVPVGAGAEAIAIDPTRNRIYVANESDRSVSVLDGTTDRVIGAPIDVGLRPAFIAVDPSQNKIYVACQCATAPNVAVIDAGNANAVKNLRYPATGPLAAPTGFAVNPASHELYIGATSDRSTKITYVDASDTPRDIEVGTDMGSRFAFNARTNTVFFVTGGVNTPEGRRLTVIDGANRSVVTRRAFPAPPAGVHSRRASEFLAVDPDTNNVYVTGQEEGPLCIPDGCTNAYRTRGVLVAFDGNDGYAPKSLLDGPVTYPVWQNVEYNPGTKQLIVYGIQVQAGNAVIARFDGTAFTGQAEAKPRPPSTFNQHLQMAVNPDPAINRAYLSQIDSVELNANGGLAVADMTTPRALPTIGTGRVFISVAVNPTTDKIYAIDRNNGTVAILK